MCGHVGIAGKLEHKDEALIDRLLLFDVFRGFDSTGLAVIKNDKTANTIKLASHPLDLFEMKKYATVRLASTAQAFIGHNRAATRGARTNTNAHPYTFDHITGAHNGTLNAASIATLKAINGEEHGTDSAALFAAIAKIGVENVIPQLESGKDSAWSLVWHDANSHTINFIRNDQRPMLFGFNKKFDKLIWASEWPTMDAAVASLPSDWELYENEKANKFWWSKVDELYTWKLEELKGGSEALPFPPTSALKGKPQPLYTTPTNTHGTGVGANSNVFGRAGVNNSSNRQPKTWTTTSQSNNDHVHLYPKDGDPLAGVWSQDQFKTFVTNKCQWCGGPLEYNVAGHSLFVEEDICVCADCAANDVDQTRFYVDDIKALTPA